MMRDGAMTKWLQRAVAAVLLASMFCAPLLYPAHAQAQFFEDDPDSELSQEQEDEFFEGTTDEFGAPTGLGEQDITEGDAYVDETQQPATITVGGRQVQLRLASDREMLPMNAVWGAGTGLLIGGWFALIDAGTNRDTQRSIGLGIVIGSAIGVLVGLKTVINPDTATVSQNESGPSTPRPTWSPLVTMDDSGTKLGVRLTF